MRPAGSHLTAALFSIVAIGLLSACGGNNTPRSAGPRAEMQTPSTGAQTPMNAMNTPGAHDLPPVKVGILLPLSGQNAALGAAMLQSAQLALFDTGYTNFELIPRDTGDSPDTARQAAQSAIADGAQLILGPIFSASVRAVKPVTENARIGMIAFSNDWKLTGGNTYIMGFTPFDQVERITDYAARKNIQRVAVLSPADEYGQAVTGAFSALAPRYGISIPAKASFPANGTNFEPIIQKFSPAAAQAQALLLPADTRLSASLSERFSAAGLPPSRLKRLGTGLLDENGQNDAIARNPALQGTWFAAPPTALRDQFEQRYRATYGSTPPRLTTLAYDATALAAALARKGFESGTNAPAYNRNAITDPNGFSGLDGIFRFRSDGRAERGLAVFEFQNGRRVIIEDAPRTFQTPNQTPRS
ncbi:MAG: penicillin-binding protein activator [Alphaproteobacteria bacterium]|nr:penicillin-binding protein activator [Alphaproteobacteria bacterium]